MLFATNAKAVKQTVEENSQFKAELVRHNAPTTIIE
jgi:hypothetical protein